MTRYVRSLFVVSAFACMAMSSAAAACSRPQYPRESLSQVQEGISLLGFLVTADGRVTRSVVFSSSGSTALDRAAQEALSACEFKRSPRYGKLADVWVQMMYVWSMADDARLVRAKLAAEAAAAGGDPAAQFQLSLLLGSTAKTGADRERAEALLQAAADMGLAHAQYEVGHHYEQGLGGKMRDRDAALAWYRKAAAQGDVMAIQRIERSLSPPKPSPAPAPAPASP